MSADPEQIFKYLDENNKEYISKDDLKKAIRYLGIIKTKDDLNYLVKDLPDEIDYQTYTEIIEQQKQSAIDKDQLIKAFEIFDENKSGKCLAKDLFHAISVIGEKVDENEIEKLKKIASIDCDGYLDYKDFIDKLIGVNK